MSTTTASAPSATYLTSANLFAQAAEQIALSATPIIAVLMLGAGPGEIGLLAAAQTLPFFLLSIPLGLLADRVSRKRLMLAAEAVRTLALLGLVVACSLDKVSLTLLAVLGLLGAIGTVAFTVTAPALIPSLVDKSQLTKANSQIELARSLAYAAGPALGGALVSWTGATAAFSVAAMLSIGAFLLLLKIGDARSINPTKRKIRQEIAEGAQFISGHRYLLPILQCSIAWNIAWFILQAAYVPYAMGQMGLTGRAVGLSLAAYGLGMVTGALLATKIIVHIRFGTALLLGPVLSVLASAVMLLTLWLPHGLLAGIAFFFFGFGPIIWTISSTTLRQTVTPPQMLGRVGSLFLTVNAGIRPLGAALGGLIGSYWGETDCLWASFGAFLVQALVIGLSSVRRLQQLPDLNER
jgi:predicted MFS family arabinose efflux permease